MRHLPSAALTGDRYLKAWDIGRKETKRLRCLARALPGSRMQVLDVVGYERLDTEHFPTIQRAIEKRCTSTTRGRR